MSSASFARATPTDLPILIINGEKDPVVAETVSVAADAGQSQTSLVLNGMCPLSQPPVSLHSACIHLKTHRHTDTDTHTQTQHNT